MSNKKLKFKMDCRCPRKLKYMPDTWCPLAVLRLKNLRNSGRELSEKEEEGLPGCPWAIDHQLANYCYFKYIAEYMEPNKTLSDIEIASLLNISPEEVKRIEKRALSKLRDKDVFALIKKSHIDGPLVEEKDGPEFKVIK